MSVWACFNMREWQQKGMTTSVARNPLAIKPAPYATFRSFIPTKTSKPVSPTKQASDHTGTGKPSVEYLSAQPPVANKNSGHQSAMGN
jgi:hypothetical protein